MRASTAAIGIGILFTATGCSIIDSGLEQAVEAAEISLQTPGSLDGIPQLQNPTGIDPNVQNQPPGLSAVVGTYGRNGVPVLTLHAYSGAPAGISVVTTSYETTLGGDQVGSSRCVQQSGQAATCWRSQNNLLVGVSTIDGRSLESLAGVVDEAWTSVRS